MKCPQCGTPMGVHTLPSYTYEVATLENVDEHVCPNCGETAVAIPAVEALHKALVEAIASAKRRLTPEEIRFARKAIGWSGRDLARALRVSPEQVSRWEGGHQTMSETTEALFRFVITTTTPPVDYEAFDAANAAAEAESKPGPIRVAPARRGNRVEWTRVA